ncbi:hypothetical protein NC653_031356 [Populus alba x Populus x berolinensis]|uniref:LysM domain-containing protein n=1 Tax=Populus alba x Populus x berolinensis TaxID=444605 RepID=A0AAD6LYJ2_9ROSI|nr:hypothetical protein NC653_031356 [Populus alba x Populus x berolinensis]
MEVKLSHRRFSDLSLPRFHFPNPKTTFPSPRFLLFSSDPLMHFPCFLSLFAKDLILFFSFLCCCCCCVCVCVCFNCSLKWWVNSKKPFTVLAERWRFHIQDISKGQSSTNPYLLHVVKEGETLTSISEQYGVSLYSVAAANKNKLDVDLVFEGQLLNIPASAPADTQVYQVKKCESPSFDQLERLQNFMKIMDGFLNQKPFITVTTLRLPHFWFLH